MCFRVLKLYFLSVISGLSEYKQKYSNIAFSQKIAIMEKQKWMNTAAVLTQSSEW